ncbi:HipA domain-containing protein [Roseateles sp. So40a]|uniref:HipA domain-containing protein n=1 Tax=Roseateles sp. So40a TaxID=3400226 RepID=UPI003A8A1C02
MTGLAVWLDEHEVGWLRPADGERPEAATRLSLAYLERWTAEVLGYALAPTLPMPARGGPGSELADDAVMAYFSRLLPAGEARQQTFAALGLPPEDVFGALRAMGRDLAGAVRLIDEGRGRPAGPTQRQIPREELSERLRHRDALPFAVWDGLARGALPGASDKLGVYVERDGGWHLVDGPQMASTHVLRPAPLGEGGHDRSFDEYFCMRLAARLGVEVAPVELHCVPEPVLLVGRFDRQRMDDGRVRRVHAIEATQARGDSLSALFALLGHSPTPLVDGRALLRWVAFHHLIGQSAPDARNVSFFVDHGGLRLAPAHGFRSGPPGSSAPAPFTADDWAAFARDSELAPRALALELKRMGEAVRAQAEALAEELAAEVPRPVVERLLQLTTTEGDRLVALAPEIAR